MDQNQKTSMKNRMDDNRVAKIAKKIENQAHPGHNLQKIGAKVRHQHHGRRCILDKLDMVLKMEEEEVHARLTD